MQDATDAGAIYTRILHKFNITDEMEKYSIFTLSGETGDGIFFFSDFCISVASKMFAHII